MRFCRFLLASLNGALLLGILTACDSAPAPYQVVKSYNYQIDLAIPGEQFKLRSTSRRFYPFRAHPAPEGSKIFAYFIQHHGGGGYSIFAPAKSKRLDTLEVAVPAARADSLFDLTQAFFRTLALTNLDTVREGQKFTVPFDDSEGILQISWHGKTLMGQVEALHDDRTAQQSAAFLRVYDNFYHLFPPTASQRPKN